MFTINTTNFHPKTTIVPGSKHATSPGALSGGPGTAGGGRSLSGGSLRGTMATSENDGIITVMAIYQL